MIKTCKKCGRTYNDATQWKDCPHYHKPEDENRRPEDNAMDDLTRISLGSSIFDSGPSHDSHSSDSGSSFDSGGGDFGGGGSSGDW